MSYYYNYYIGFEKDGKLFPFGPYNSFGKFCSVLSVSASFASDLHSDFYKIKEDQISDELRKNFEYEDWNGKKTVSVKYMDLNDLPFGSYMRSGYVLMSEVEECREADTDFFEFSVVLSPDVYAAKILYQCMFGKNALVEMPEGEYQREYNASEFMYFMWPDYHSKEYEAFLIRSVAAMLDEYRKDDFYKIVILETEG